MFPRWQRGSGLRGAGLPGPAAAAELRAVLTARAGGSLRNPVRQAGATCEVCTLPVLAHRLCFRCDGQSFRDGLADATAFLIYAVEGERSGSVMRGFKAPSPVEEHYHIVSSLVRLALAGHLECPGALAGGPVTHWAVVPSLPATPGQHPLRQIVAETGLDREVPLAAAAQAPYPQAVDPRHFSVPATLRRRSHVLLLDDTWTAGGHAQSAALALRGAGAGRVSVLVVARCLTKESGGNATFLRTLSGRDYDPGICPWTGGACPPQQSQR